MRPPLFRFPPHFAFRVPVLLRIRFIRVIRGCLFRFSLSAFRVSAFSPQHLNFSTSSDPFHPRSAHILTSEIGHLKSDFPPISSPPTGRVAQLYAVTGHSSLVLSCRLCRYLHHDLSAFARPFNHHCLSAFPNQLPRLLHHSIDHVIVMAGIVMKK